MNPVIEITRRERFNAAHRLFKSDFDDAENLKVFGKCSNPNWHGHNYVLYVTVRGEVNPDTGFVVNLSWLSALIRDRIIEKADHRNLNLEVEFMQGRIPTAENIAISIWDELYLPVKEAGADLYKIQLEETENNYVEYFG